MQRATKAGHISHDVQLPARCSQPSQLWNQKMNFPGCETVFLLYLVLVLKFHILSSIWPDSLTRRQNRDSGKQTRYFSDWFPVPVLNKPCSHMLPREHSSLPQPTTIALFSQQGIAFPILTLALAWTINWRVLLPGFVCSEITWTWVPVLTLQLAGYVTLESDFTFLKLSYFIC